MSYHAVDQDRQHSLRTIGQVSNSDISPDLSCMQMPVQSRFIVKGLNVFTVRKYIHHAENTTHTPYNHLNSYAKTGEYLNRKK